jgi:hypothetical protein
MPTRLFALLSTPLSHELDDIAGRRAGQKTGNVVQMNPAALGDFVVGPSLGVVWNIAGEDVMMFLLATEVEQKLGRLAGKTRFFLEFPKRGFRQMFAALEDAAWQRPLRLAASDQNSFASTTDYGGAFFQTGLHFLSD